MQLASHTRSQSSHQNLIALAIIPLHSAFANDVGSPFESVAAYCDYGTFSLAGRPGDNAPLLAVQVPTFRVKVWDGDTLLGSVEFLWDVISNYSGNVSFSQTPAGDTVVFELWVKNVGPVVAPGLAPGNGRQLTILAVLHMKTGRSLRKDRPVDCQTGHMDIARTPCMPKKPCATQH